MNHELYRIAVTYWLLVIVVVVLGGYQGWRTGSLWYHQSTGDKWVKWSMLSTFVVCGYFLISGGISKFDCFLLMVHFFYLPAYLCGIIGWARHYRPRSS